MPSHHAQTLAKAEMPSKEFMFGFFMLGTVLTYFGNILVGARNRYLEIRLRQQYQVNRYVQDVPTSNNQAPQLASRNLAIKNLINDKQISAEQIAAMNAPTYMKCKGTGKLMFDPVATINGDVFDREYIEQYLEEHNNVDPNGKQLANNWLFPDVDLRRQIIEEIEKYSAELPPQINSVVLTFMANARAAANQAARLNPPPVPNAETLRNLCTRFLDGMERAFDTNDAPRPNSQ